MYVRDLEGKNRSITLSVRTFPETREMLKKLTKIKSQKFGTELTQGQVFEMVLSKALERESKTMEE